MYTLHIISNISYWKCMAREVEIKFKVDKKELKVLAKWLKDNAEFKKEIHHVEYYLDNPKISFIFRNKNGFVDSADYLRVRFAEGKDSVCLKRFTIDEESQTSENIDEIEYSVSKGEDALKLFKNLGYTNETIIDKTRKIYDYRNFEIVIDNIKNLGDFTEIELKEDFEGDIKIGRDKIYNLLKEIGFKEIRVQMRGYVSMIWNPDKDFTKVKNLD